jgi:hypothetical protein
VKRLAGTLLAAAAMVVGGTLPAHATPSWTMAACVAPDLVSAQQDDTSDWLVVSGTGRACGPAGTDSGFRIATYPDGQPTGIAEGYNVRLFDQPYPGRVPVRRFGTAISTAQPGEYGVCLLAGKDERAGCALVTVTGTGKDLTVTLTPLPVNDPLVVKPVVTSPYQGTTNPPVTGGVCATCF